MKSWGSCLVAALAATGFSQLRPAMKVSAIVGAKLEVRPGVIIEKGTIIMKDGLITAVGANVAVPVGAEVLDGKGLFVYAGFIDGGTDKGLRKIEDASQDWTDPDITQGAPTQMRAASKQLRPDLKIASYFDGKDDVWKGYRSSGFTTAVLLPSSGIFQGQVCAANLDGRPRRDAILSENLGLFTRFEGRPPVYPGTDLGAFASARQQLMDAQWYRGVKAYYNSGQGQRPPNDPALEALQSVLTGDVPAFINAEDYARIDRAIDWAHEFGIRPIVFGGTEAYKVGSKLKTFSVPLIATIAWPMEPMPEPEKPAEKPGDKPKSKEEPKEKPAEPEEQKALGVERQRQWLQIANNLVEVNKLGLAFGLSTKGTKSHDEFFTNVRRLVKLGLPKEAALNSLTLGSARVLGLDRQLGSIEVGKIANLTIFSGDFFDAKSKVSYVYIDGVKFDPNSKTTKWDNSVPDFGGEVGH